jgi:hypothetical protein
VTIILNIYTLDVNNGVMVNTVLEGHNSAKRQAHAVDKNE